MFLQRAARVCQKVELPPSNGKALFEYAAHSPSNKSGTINSTVPAIVKFLLIAKVYPQERVVIVFILTKDTIGLKWK